MKYLIATIAAIVLLTCIVKACYSAEARSIVVLDGDTVRADIHLGFDVVLREQTIRLFGFDAWEVSRRRRTVQVDEAEMAKGEKAKAALAKLVHEAKRVEVVESGERDPFGRRSCSVYVDGKSLADIMRRNGHERK